MIEFDVFYCQTPYISDPNFITIAYDSVTREALCVDAPDASAITSRCVQKGYKLTHLLLTHHHIDHVAGAEDLRAQLGCKIIGAKFGAARLPRLDISVDEHEMFQFCGYDFCCELAAGHTNDLAIFYCHSLKVMLLSDALFVGGSGRLYEGTPAMAWAGLQLIRTFPDDYRFFCGHDYANINTQFACDIAPDDVEVGRHRRRVLAAIDDGSICGPALLGFEKLGNINLRSDDVTIARALGMEQASAPEVLAEIRRRRNSYSIS